MNESNVMHLRQQQTIRRPQSVTGIGFLTGADVTVRFLPAPPNHGIVFQRVDLPETPQVLAHISNCPDRKRRTALQKGEAVIELTEHVLAALAGLQVDNCLVQLNAPELPGGDGSSLLFADAIMQAEIIAQDAPRPCVPVSEPLQAHLDGLSGLISVEPNRSGVLEISYDLNYGPESPVPVEQQAFTITPESFLNELAFARTFIQETEIDVLRAQGYGTRTTAADLIVFRADGSVMDNKLRIEDECVRHKILDCIGDFALIGCDLIGTFHATQSGHELNREIIRQVARSEKQQLQKQIPCTTAESDSTTHSESTPSSDMGEAA